MSDLLKLNNIVQRNGDIKAFPLSSNMKSARHGKGPWGEVTVAIDSESVERLWGNDAIGILYIVGRDEWKKESEGEKMKPDGVSDNVYNELINALEKAILLIYDMSIRKVAFPGDMIRRWENLVKYARAKESEVMPIERWTGDEREIICPACKSYICYPEDIKTIDLKYRQFCGACGQKLDWESEVEHDG